jgi:hypothetical protein
VSFHIFGLHLHKLATSSHCFESVLKLENRYEGLDMSPAQFPPGPHSTVVFSTFNILEPVPTHMQATFDVLHLRLLVLGLPRNSWELACQNILSLLKPGGWVQWEEADFEYETLIPIRSDRLLVINTD